MNAVTIALPKDLMEPAQKILLHTGLSFSSFIPSRKFLKPFGLFFSFSSAIYWSSKLRGTSKLPLLGFLTSKAAVAAPKSPRAPITI